MRRTLLCLFALLLCGPLYAAPRELTAKEMAAVKRGMETRLKDAQSARFQNVLVNDEVVCGLVNAKNSMGAYAGYELFFGMVMVDTEGKTVAIIMSIGDPGVTSHMCESKGLPVPPGA